MGLEKNVLNCNARQVDELAVKRQKLLEKYGILTKEKKKQRTIHDLYYIRYKKKFR